jgi:hypothetical protein
MRKLGHPSAENKDQYFCKKCQQWVDKSGWYYSKTVYGNPRRDGMCKICRRSYRKDAKKLYDREYYKKNREHYLELYRKWSEDNLERKLWHSCKNRAKEKGLEFNIEISDIVIPKFCPVLGLPIDTHAEAGTGSGHRVNPYKPSVDRIDNTKGYIKGNIRVISWRCNTLKSDATLNEIERIYFYMKELLPLMSTS